MPNRRVAIDARLIAGTSGGVETFVAGLAYGLAQVPHDDLDISFITVKGQHEWLDSHVGPRIAVVEIDRVAISSRGRALGPLRPLVRRLYQTVRERFPRIPVDREMNQVGADLVHFTHQFAGFVTSPFVYQPHDLQHLHLPGLFTRAQLRRRAACYGPLCRTAARVVVGTSWVKDDVVVTFGLDPASVTVIPLAPLIASDAAATPPRLPADFFLYPAAPWPHKNHRRLIKAFAEVATTRPDAHLVLTGARVVGAIDLDAEAAAAGVADRVHALGYLTESELAAVFGRARAVVVPTLFESASFPVWEAFQRGVPVTCSTATALPRQVGDAAILFDPHDTAAMADAMARIWDDAELRVLLIERGRRRVADFSWVDTARRYVALYRSVLGIATADDAALLGEEPRL